MRHPDALLQQVLQQRGLADPRLAAQDQHPALTRLHAGEQLVQRLALAAPATQRRSVIALGHTGREARAARPVFATPR